MGIEMLILFLLIVPLYIGGIWFFFGAAIRRHWRTITGRRQNR